MPATYVIKLTALGPRVRGLRARYLSKNELNALILAPTIDDALNVLKNTDYGEVVERLGKVTSEAQVANEIRAHIVKVLSALAFSAPEPASSVLRSYLMRFELENVKAIAKSLIKGLERSYMEGLVNVAVEEELGRRHVLAMMMSVRDVEDLRSRLIEINHPAGPALDTYLRISKQFQQYSIALLDTLIDKAFIEYLSKLTRIDESVSRFIHGLTNYYNVNIILRGKLWGLPQEVINELVVPTGPVASTAVKIYGESPTRIIEEMAVVFPAMDELIKVTGSSDLRLLVQYLGPFSYKFARILEEYVLSLYTEFSPGAAVAAAHLKFTEGEVVIALLNAYLEGLPRDFVAKLYGPVI